MSLSQIPEGVPSKSGCKDRACFFTVQTNQRIISISFWSFFAHFCQRRGYQPSRTSKKNHFFSYHPHKHEKNVFPIIQNRENISGSHICKNQKLVILDASSQSGLIHFQKKRERNVELNEKLCQSCLNCILPKKRPIYIHQIIIYAYLRTKLPFRQFVPQTVYIYIRNN